MSHRRSTAKGVHVAALSLGLKVLQGLHDVVVDDQPVARVLRAQRVAAADDFVFVLQAGIRRTCVQWPRSMCFR